MITKQARGSRAHRRNLLLSAASIGMLAAAVAHAQDVAGPKLDNSQAVLEAQGAGATGAFAMTGPDREPQIVIANPNTTVTDRDPNNVTGIGQMIIDERTGYIDLCTATLINPRTVIFAAHCVNERAATAYGQDSGGQPIGFGFGNNNNAAGASAFGGWLGNYATNTARNMYDSNYVSYNPLSTEPNASGFLYGDIAVASLDTPAAGIPTWALLFSPLNNPGTIGANGTGYHVTIEGYGNNGTASTGSTGGIDYRRRIAENMVGGLASLGDFEQFLFGPTGATNATNPQNLYWIDFDDPKRGTAGASPYDFNAWRDNAVTDGKEGTTASGDSGGPLILDQTYAKQLVIGVLSGGYSQFIDGQPLNGYGTASFYQPLYLYWDWIAANNPYHYVTSKAGNADWTDPTHWQTALDPNYYVISGSSVVNGTPTSPGAGNTVQPGFGQACIQTNAFSDCEDMATGTETVTNNPIGTSATTSAAGNDKGIASVGDASNDKSVVTSSTLSAQADGGSSVTSSGSQTPQAPNPTLPAPTLDNGLAGATNFVPNNYDGNRLGATAAQIKPRYFDVTLAATGTTTVTTNVVIDNLTINGAGAVLDIRPSGSLTSNLGISQKVGTVNVDGRLTTGGDYFLLLGGLSGTGTITTPYFTNTAGVIAPGTAGTVGQLTFNGNVILSSASTLLIDIAGNHTSDVIRVGAPTLGSGIASLGGQVVVTPTAAVRAGDTYTFLIANGGIQAGTTFNAPAAISAILTPTLIYSSNAVSLRIDAGSYLNLLKGTGNSTLIGYAQLLDQNRNNQTNYPGVYGYLDLQSAATISSSLLGLAPQAQTLRNAIGTVAMDTTSSFFRERLDTISGGKAGGTLAMLGKPVQLATFGLSSLSLDARGDTSQGETVKEGALPDNMSAFIAGGYIDGSSLPMGALTSSNARDQFDGYFLGAGIETSLGGGDGVLGFGVTYTDIKGTTAFAPQSAKGQLYQGTLYGRAVLGGGVMLDAQINAGLLDIRTQRAAVLGPNSYSLVAKDRPLAVSGEVALSRRFGGESGASLTPAIGLRAASLDFTPTAESGGGPALMYAGDNRTSVEGRAGLKAQYGSHAVKAFVAGTYVHDFEDKATTFGANFVGGIGPYATFAYSGVDKDWFELSGGVKVSGRKIDLSVSGTTTQARRDIRDTTVRGALSFHF